ncbi:aspartyl/asparaginyl beta-hydroxylase domain-containing protein [Paraglaciecola aquimarina]|uniref:Aspartyl/asparaginyl beta-hydroxylase domain-containing protein n=1 Tax=Paraglaciecola algarum TaxID=3050085 RepID=A0ABS9D8D1_9ALTE|nr:aspartyl/asparaginyl beta-hydroxylase domain-containing protein [Paraglaciecola sp. G1-23]MCF2948647.1 aspartyl/asparaginyl beta-hydroxylase domain-containing protein [Paraglaciecola sp. G1-23]
MLIDRLKLPLIFDTEKMQADLELLENIDWVKHFVTQNYSGEWSIIPLRGPENASHPILMSYSDPSCKEFSDTPFLHSLAYLPEVLKSFKCPLLAVRLMKLSAGSEIKTHTDLDLNADMGTARLHIPIITHEKVTFLLNDEVVPFKLGECWYLRLSDPHSVVNRSDIDRVHLVIDVTMNAWLDSLLGN